MYSCTLTHHEAQCGAARRRGRMQDQHIYKVRQIGEVVDGGVVWRDVTLATLT